MAHRSNRRARGQVSLDRALSKLGIASRTAARRLIEAGRVHIGGRVVHDPAYALRPERGDIVVDDRNVSRAKWRTIVLNKPRGTVTTRRDPEGRRTVFDVLGDEAGSLVAVGRLDRATTGLLILTTDTQLANRLTDPGTGVIRRYAVTVRGMFGDESARKMMDGIEGLAARAVKVRKRSARETHLIVELSEGKNREIRKLCAACGYQVTALKRVAFGGLELGDLQPGDWRDVTQAEIAAAFGPSTRQRSR